MVSILNYLTDMNRFYGKLVSEMNFNELTLLSVDLQLSSFDLVNNIPNHVIQQSQIIRESLMLKCLDGDGDYSRVRFESDFRGENPNMFEGVFDEFVEVEQLLN